MLKGGKVEKKKRKKKRKRIISAVVASLFKREAAIRVDKCLLARGKGCVLERQNVL